MEREANRDLQATDLTGWFLYSGEEDSEYINNPENFIKVSLPSLIRDDPSIGYVVDLPPGSEVIRNKKDMIWRRVIDNCVYDSNGKILAKLPAKEEE